MERTRLSLVSIITVGIFLLLVIPLVQADENKSLTCGVILPLSGSFERLGNEVLRGIESANDEINARGGPDGYTISLDIADDKGDPNLTLSLFSEMKEKGIPVVIGSLTTNLTLPIAKETISDDDIIVISPRANGNDICGISPRFYQILPPSQYLSSVVSNWLLWTSKRVALVYIDDSYGRSFSENVKSDMKNTSSVTISAEIPLTADDPTHSKSVRMVLENKTDTVVIIGCDEKAIEFLKALTKAGFNGKVSLTETCLMNEIAEEISNNNLGPFALLAAQGYSPLEPGYGSSQIIADYKNDYGEDPTFTYAGFGYDSLMVVKEALLHAKQTGNVSASSLVNGLQDMRYAGVTGPKIFDDKNTVYPIYNQYIYENGTYELITQANLWDKLHEAVEVVKN